MPSTTLKSESSKQEIVITDSVTDLEKQKALFSSMSYKLIVNLHEQFNNSATERQLPQVDLDQEFIAALTTRIESLSHQEVTAADSVIPVSTEYDKFPEHYAGYIKRFIESLLEQFNNPANKKRLALTKLDVSILELLSNLIKNPPETTPSCLSAIEPAISKLESINIAKRSEGDKHLLNNLLQLRNKLIEQSLKYWKQDAENLQGINNAFYNRNAKDTRLLIEAEAAELDFETTKIELETTRELNRTYQNETQKLREELNLSRQNVTSASQNASSFFAHSMNDDKSREKNKKLKPYLSSLAFTLATILAEDYLPAQHAYTADLVKKLQNITVGTEDFVVALQQLNDQNKQLSEAEEWLTHLLLTKHVSTNDFLKEEPLPEFILKNLKPALRTDLQAVIDKPGADKLTKPIEEKNKWASFCQLYRPKKSKGYFQPNENTALLFEAEYNAVKQATASKSIALSHS